MTASQVEKPTLWAAPRKLVHNNSPINPHTGSAMVLRTLIILYITITLSNRT